MAVSILTVGKKHDAWVVDGIERYQKRLRAPYAIEWALLPHSSLEGDRARIEESERIVSRLKLTDFIVLLDERGEMLSSPRLAQQMESVFNGSQSIVFIIGGAYGVTDELRRRANLVWSLSDLVFPHQLVRLMLVEQIYRAQQITSGSGYHHE